VAGHRMRIDCRIFSHGDAAFTGRYDDENIAVFTSFLRPGDNALDVGANIGFYTVPLALAARKARAHVIAVEPFPNNLEWLRGNLRLNAAEDLVSILPTALSDHTGRSPLVLTEDFLTGASVGNAAIDSDDLYDEGLRRISVPVETLDRLWPSLGLDGPLRIIKLDIEGREAEFLRGGQATISRYRPIILTEINRWFYEKRGLDFDTLIPSVLPPEYRPFDLRAGRLVPLSTLSQCTNPDVFLVPGALLD
jgi:FkbM family methyltransferase